MKILLLSALVIGLSFGQNKMILLDEATDIAAIACNCTEEDEACLEKLEEAIENFEDKYDDFEELPYTDQRDFLEHFLDELKHCKTDISRELSSEITAELVDLNKAHGKGPIIDLGELSEDATKYAHALCTYLTAAENNSADTEQHSEKLASLRKYMNSTYGSIDNLAGEEKKVAVTALKQVLQSCTAAKAKEILKELD